MKPERWQEASRILESVLERDPARRAGYLDDVCANDDDLRQEVESLLAASEQAGSLLDSPAMEMAAPLFVQESTQSLLGQSIGRYQIISALGSGAMGEVYLAHDTRLGRKIALKLLPAHFTTDKDRLRRFEQEAHTASTLSHPNVCVIHEVGETENDRHYISMEYVEGVTLRQHLAGGPLKLTEALDVAIQVASALGAAHAAGIAHRDIKPENIMIRADGLIKVLDFGLAKLTEPQTIDPGLAKRALVQTDPGTVMGTTTYMSPEQARGVTVDVRTDIWSLGVVLYEMISGHRPFEGETPGDLIAAILKTEPGPLTCYVAEAPIELENLARKVLEKNREARYQTAVDLLNDLKEIKQELDFQTKLGRSTQPETTNQATEHLGSGRSELQTGQVGAIHTDQDTLGRTLSSAEYLVSEIKQHKLGLLVILATLLGVIALTYGIYRFAGPHGSNAHFQKIDFSPLTTVGNAIDATVSPDGRLISYVQLENGKYSLWTKAVATNNAIQIVPPTEAVDMGKTTFSPDGNNVYYSVRETTGPDVLYQVNVWGGTPRKVLTKDSATSVTFSPDGKQFALVCFTVASGESQLIIVNADGADERILARRSGNGIFNGGGPSWSPDGKIIATGALVAGSTPRRVTMVGIAVESGEVKTLSPQSWPNIQRVEWFSDGSGLVLSGPEKPGGKIQLWQLSYPGGEVRRISNDMDDYGDVSLTSSGALVTTRKRTYSNIWIVPNGDANQARQLTFRGDAREGGGGVAWTPEGRIVYSSKAAGGVYSNIWIMNADGGSPRQLTDSPANDWFPAVSPDGHYIVFSSNLSGEFNLWRMDISGGNLKQLTNGKSAFAPEFSRDGRWVACMFKEHEKTNIWKIPVDGSSPVQLTETSGSVPTVSWDGKLLAYDAYEERAEKKTKVIVIPSEGGPPVKVLDYTPLWNTGLQWSPDDSSIIFVNLRQGGANLWRLPLDGSPARQLTDFKSEQIFNFEFTPDGRQLVCARGTVTSDVVMISESK